MKENMWGRIFNIGSSSAYNGGELASLYCSSKHALLGFSRSMSKELHDYKIRVCILVPNSIKTNMENTIKYIPRFQYFSRSR